MGTAADEAAEAENRRWHDLWHEILEPMRLRSIELHRQCEAESCAREEAERAATRWRAEAEVFAQLAATATVSSHAAPGRYGEAEVLKVRGGISASAEETLSCKDDGGG